MSKGSRREREAVWEAFDYEDVIRNTPNEPLPDCNRGSWFCPVASKDDADRAAEILEECGFTRVYDLGAGTLQFAVDLDRRGYDVIAYESLETLTDYAQNHLPENDVDVRNRDYHSDWSDIRGDKALFVALGKVNSVPGDVPNGIVVDGMEVGNV